MFTKLFRWFHWFLQARWLWTNVQTAKLQHHRALLLEKDRYENAKRLNRFEYQVFSQNGEDGILNEIFNRIGMTDKTFLEIGVENGLETNTTFLLLKGWNGTWIESNGKSVSFIKNHFAAPLREGRLSVQHETVSKENIVSLLTRLNIPKCPDLLSIDIDRNTYHVLEAILGSLKPQVIVTEYNGLLPPNVDWKVEYSPAFHWNRTSYFGASLKAYERLCRQFDYSLVGCDICGINAFFVRSNICSDKFEAPFTAENHYEPARHFLVHRMGYPRAFTDIL